MHLLVRFLAFLLLGILRGSCCLVYKLTHNLSPPKTASELACIKGYQSQNQCNKNCTARYERDLDWYGFRRDMADRRRDQFLDRCLRMERREVIV